MSTFQQVWRTAWLHAPTAPNLLVQAWAQGAYAKVLNQRDAWSWLRRESLIRLPALEEGTVGVTQDATTVTSNGLVLTAAHVNRQLRTPGGPLYTILSVASGTATLDKPWVEATGLATSVQVYQAYLTMPAGFLRWLSLTDRESQQPITLYTTERELDAWDPTRTQVNSARLHLASYRPDAAGAVRYELWPHVTVARVLSGTYLLTGAALDDDDTLPGGVTQELLLAGTLAEAASWPGTPQQRNPYFNLQLARVKREEFEQLLNDLELEDENRYLTWLHTPEARVAVGGGGFARQAYDD